MFEFIYTAHTYYRNIEDGCYTNIQFLNKTFRIIASMHFLKINPYGAPQINQFCKITSQSRFIHTRRSIRRSYNKFSRFFPLASKYIPRSAFFSPPKFSSTYVISTTGRSRESFRKGTSPRVHSSI